MHGGHLGHVTKIFCIDFGSLSISNLHMKFEFIWANDCEKTMFYYIDGTPISANKLKGQRSTLTFGTYL